MAQDTAAIQTEVRRRLGSLLRRGQQDGTIRHDVRTADLVIFGALLSQQLPHVPDWNRTARRLVDIYLAWHGTHDPTLSEARQPDQR